MWAGDKNAVAVYRFHNAGNSPITITSLKTSCGCTTAEMSKKTFAAGEAGEVKATFEVGDRVGQQTKLITVISDDVPSRTTNLVLEVNIREFATMNPRFVYWRVGEATSEKRIEIAANASQTIAAVEARPIDLNISARIEQVEPGRKYILWLMPVSTAKALVINVSCAISIEGRSQSVLSAYASVMK